MRKKPRPRLCICSPLGSPINIRAKVGARCRVLRANRDGRVYRPRGSWKVVSSRGILDLIIVSAGEMAGQHWCAERSLRSVCRAWKRVAPSATPVARLSVFDSCSLRRLVSARDESPAQETTFSNGPVFSWQTPFCSAPFWSSASIIRPITF